MRVLDVIREATEADKVVAMTSQCLWGAVNMNVYSNGRDLLSAGWSPRGIPYRRRHTPSSAASWAGTIQWMRSGC